MHFGKLGQVTNFTVVCGTAKHCVNQYMVLFCYCSLGGDTAMPGGLNARLCHAFLGCICSVMKYRKRQIRSIFFESSIIVLYNIIFFDCCERTNTFLSK